MQPLLDNPKNLITQKSYNAPLPGLYIKWNNEWYPLNIYKIVYNEQKSQKSQQSQQSLFSNWW